MPARSAVLIPPAAIAWDLTVRLLQVVGVIVLLVLTRVIVV
jgi:hypothetical protein